MKRIVLIPAFLLFCFSLQAQRKKPKTEVVIVPGKVLNYQDSMRVKVLFYDALKNKTSGNLQEAVNKFKSVLAIDPANHAAMYELGYYYHNQKREQEAEVMIRNAVTVFPDNKWYWLLLSDIYKKVNNFSQLELVFDELIRLAPGNEGYYFDKAKAQLFEKKADKATKTYNEIERLFGETQRLVTARRRMLYQQGKFDEIIDDLQDQLKEQPDNIRLYVTLASIYNKNKEVKKALAILEKAKEIDPANALVRLSLADFYRNAKNFDQAFEELKIAFADPNLNINEKAKIVLSFLPLFKDAKARLQAEELALIATQIHTHEAKAFLLLGDIYFQQQKYNEAMSVYKKGLQLDNQVYPIWEQLLRVQLQQNSYNEVIENGNTALSIFPNQAPLYLYTSMAYIQNKNPEKAVSLLKTASNLQIQAVALHSQIYSALGDAYHFMENDLESDKAYEKSIKINPDNSYTLNNYSYYLSLRGEKLDLAEKMSKRSNELQPQNAAFEDTYAWVLFKLGNYSSARIWMEKALSHDKKANADKLEHYGDILYHLNEPELALEQWKNAQSGGIKTEILDRKINEKKYIE